jgi:hypothetical protein
MCQMPRRNPQLFNGSADDRTDFCARLVLLSQTAKSIVSVADNLIFDLIGLLTHDGRSNG